MKHPLRTTVACLLLAIPLLGPAQTQHSTLWGQKGEKWDRDGLLRDFTSVGYMRGKVPIPEWPVGVNVKEFGAKGDGKQDDTQAFRDAIAACPPRHAILIPKGRYRITEQIRLEPDDKSNFVFRGEDRFESVIFFPLYLTEIYGIPFGKKHRASNPQNEGFFRFSGGTHRSFENVSFEFREQPNGSHWEFIGADAIYFNGVENSWIRNVYIKNADQAITLWGGNTKNISVVNVIFDQYIDRWNRGRVGHMPLAVSSSHSLFHNILLTGKWEHDILTHQSPQHNVWSKVKGPDVEIDHHSAGSDFGLFTEIYGGLGSTIQYDFYGSNETYWNVRSEMEVSFSNPENHNVIVGINTSDPSEAGADFWHENVDPRELKPANLYVAQLDRVGKPRPVEIPLTVPPRTGEVRVFPYSAIGPLNMGSPDRNHAGELPLARKTFQDKNTMLFLLKFDLSSAVLKEIPRAALRLSGVHNPENVRVQTVEDDAWTEMTVTYNTAPQGVEELNVEASAVDPETVVLDVTGFVRQQMTGDRVVSFRVEAKSKGGAVNGGQGRLIIGPEDTMAYPSTPSGLKATKTEDGIRIEWDASPETDVKSYSLYRDPRVDKEVAAFAGLVDNHFVDRLVTHGMEYTYHVTAVDTGTRESAPSQKVTFTFPSPP